MNKAAPADALDAACRAHDLCYERFGQGARQCDKASLRANAALARRRRDPETVRSKAATGNPFFQRFLCTKP